MLTVLLALLYPVAIQYERGVVIWRGLLSTFSTASRQVEST